MKYILKEKVEILSLIFAKVFSLFKLQVAQMATLQTSRGMRLVLLELCCVSLSSVLDFECICPSGVELYIKRRGCQEVENLSGIKCQSNS